MNPAPIILLVALVGPTTSPTDPVLPRGLGFRVASEPETPKQLLEDVYYVQQAIPESSLDDPTQKTLFEAVDDAFGRLKALAKAEPVDEATRGKAQEVRDELDRHAGNILSTAQRKRLVDRTRIVFSELFLLNNGVDPTDVDGEVAKTLKLSAEQKQTLLKGIQDMEAAVRELKGPNQLARADLLNQFRTRFRSALTESQRNQWDQIVLKSLKKAAEESKK